MMSDTEFRPSEFQAVEEMIPMDLTPTPHAVAIVPEIPASERHAPPIVLDDTDERVEGLLKELLIQLKERKALEDVAAARWHRCSELLEQVRTARLLLRDLLGDAENKADLMRRLEDGFFDAVITDLQAWLAKPL